MERQSKFDETVKKTRRYSGLFEPLQRSETEKYGRARRASTGNVDSSVNNKLEEKYEKRLMKSICEPNIPRSDLNKSLKRRNAYLIKEITNSEKLAQKLVNIELIQKKLETDLKPHLRKPMSYSESHSPKTSSATKSTKSKKAKRELRSTSHSDKHVACKENLYKTNVLELGRKSAVSQLLSREISPSKSDNNFPVEKTQKKINRHKKNSKKNENQVQAEVAKSRPTPASDNKEIDQKIIDYYLDKTIRKFNNLETIYESPKGSETCMGRRKVKRYLNFDDAYSPIRQSKRKVKVRRAHPNFNFDSLHLENLRLLDVDDMVK